MQVKTIGPSSPNPNYGLTRAFCQALGDAALFESGRLWAPGNPALTFVKHLCCATDP